VVVNLFYRELGFVTAKGNPLGIATFEDLLRKGIRFVNRQAGSGTRLLLDHHLEKRGISTARIAGYDQEVFTHIEVGLAILSGNTDTGIATAAVSSLLGHDLRPVDLFPEGDSGAGGGAQQRALPQAGRKTAKLRLRKCRTDPLHEALDACDEIKKKRRE
jgi:ABC-type amino acid transport substrate-binding protein